MVWTVSMVLILQKFVHNVRQNFVKVISEGSDLRSDLTSEAV